MKLQNTEQKKIQKQSESRAVFKQSMVRRISGRGMFKPGGWNRRVNQLGNDSVSGDNDTYELA